MANLASTKRSRPGYRWALALTLAASVVRCAPTQERPAAVSSAAQGEQTAQSELTAQAAAQPSRALTPEPSGGNACPRASSLEPAVVADEAVCLLREYVRIDTTNPPGNELPAARFLQAVLARDGIESRLLEAAPGRANLIARLPAPRRRGAPGGAVMLMHHMDVVPARVDEWSAPPFAGELREGAVWGRGTLDNKGGGVIALMTLLLAKRLSTPLERDLVFLALADEESGGRYGARFLAEHHRELFSDVEFALNEGGSIVLGEERAVYNVELAQKAPLWLKVTARGRSGHGAAPEADSAVLTLLRGLSRLAQHRFPVLVLPEVQALYAARALSLAEPLRTAYADLRAALARPELRARFLAQPRDAALVQNTLAITQLTGSDKENVIAGEASAVLDLRLLPGQDPAAITREVVQVLAEPAIEVTPILSFAAHASPRETALFAAIEAYAARRDPGALVVANVIAGFTDCNAFRAQGITCYGFLPLRLSPDAFSQVHGKDERMPVQTLATAVVDLHEMLAGLRAATAARR